MAERDEIDRVRSSVNIVEVVSPYVALKRSGATWKGCCPFHSEKTPSFQVNPEKNAFYCFGCSEHGDVFGFLQKIENLSFSEALERLASIAGITLSNRRHSPEEVSKKDRLYNALEVATRYYQETLMSNDVARNYILERGIAHEMMVSFRLGYAGELFDGLAAWFRRNHVNLDDAVEAGILTKGDRGYDPYDKLRGRIVCPILDVHDRPIAFGGRQMEDIKDRPKYLNTAETPLFSKGRTFFGMSRARKSIAEKAFAVVVEGYFDVISAHQAGFLNVVATLGTSLTPDHAEILGRQARRVMLAFDADSAGIKAAQRANAIFEAQEFEVLVLDLPKGEDPDSLLRKGKAHEFTRAIDEAVPIREFQLRTVIEQYSGNASLTERDKAAIFKREITPLLRSTPSIIERERYIRMASTLHPFFSQGSTLAEDQIRQEIGDGAKPAYQQGRTGGLTRYSRGAANSAPKIENAPRSAPASGLQKAEEDILRGLMSGNKTFASLVLESITDDLFVTEPHRELVKRLLAKNRAQEQATIDDLYGNNEESNLFARLMAATDAGSSSQGEITADGTKFAPLSEAVITGSISRLVSAQNARIEQNLRDRANGGDIEAVKELVQFTRRQHEQNGHSVVARGV